MAEVEFGFTDPQGTIIAFQYENESNESGRLTARFSSEKIQHTDGTRKLFSLQFNAIGKGDPLGFLESLDEGYLNDKVAGISTHKQDLFRTIQNVRSLAEAPEYELTAAEVARIEDAIEGTAATFSGDHALACTILVDWLRRSEIECFSDDVHHLVGHQKTKENVLFHREVWPDFLMAMDDHLASNPEVVDQIDAVREGREPEMVHNDEPEM